MLLISKVKIVCCQDALSSFYLCSQPKEEFCTSIVKIFLRYNKENDVNLLLLMQTGAPGLQLTIKGDVLGGFYGDKDINHKCLSFALSQNLRAFTTSIKHLHNNNTSMIWDGGSLVAPALKRHKHTKMPRWISNNTATGVQCAKPF